jgi:diketogulonate reductase-like aldo/keto reductase
MNSMAMPLIGYGTFPLQGDEARAGVAMALEVGLRHLDTAQMYRNEAEVGRAMQASGLARAEIFLTTKVHPDNFGASRFDESVKRSLEALRTDHVDLLLLHWPHPSLEMADVLQRLIDAKEAGQARTVGVSNFGPEDLGRAQRLAAGVIACDQIELHPFVEQTPTLEKAGELGIAVTAYCPVARGKVVDDPTLLAIGEAHGRTAAQIALAWMVQRGIAVIPMTRSEHHAKANLDCLEITLSDEEISRIDCLAEDVGKLIRAAGLTTIWGKAS